VTHDHRVARVLAAMAACLRLLGHPPLAAAQAPNPGPKAVVDRAVQRFLVGQLGAALFQTPLQLLSNV
jgi:hypothetical protein